jgi:CheY-like chemotaxis protein
MFSFQPQTAIAVDFHTTGDAVVRRRSLPEKSSDWRGSGTVLLADDDKPIVTMGKTMLQMLGFDVLTACDGREAIDLFTRHKDEIVCVMLDLTMPRMDGVQAFQELYQINPDVPVIISSGHDEQEVARLFAGKRQVGFLQKPYRISGLSFKLRETLGVTLPQARVKLTHSV